MRSSLHVLTAVLIGLILPGLALADAPPPVDMDVAALGRLPVRYNGRMTTWDGIAANYLRRVSNTDTFTDQEGKRQPAIRWLLEVACRIETAVDIVNVPIDPGLAKALELASAKEDPGCVTRCSMADLVRHRQVLQHGAMAAGAKAQDQRTAGERAVLELGWRAQGFQAANAAFSLPSAAPNDPKALVAAVIELEASGIPLVVPPSDDQQQWQSLPRAFAEAMLSRAIEPDVKEDVPGAMLARIFQAYRGQKADDFNLAVADYAEAIAKLDLPAGAFQFKVPSGWLEMGGRVTGARHYGDVRGTGHVVAEFEVVDGGGRATLQIHHFNMPLARPGAVLNSWRMGQGLAPLSPANADAAVKSVRIRRRDCPLFEIRTPSGVGKPIEQLMATIVSPAGKRRPHAFEVSFYGDPKVVEGHREAFHAFVRSWRFGSAEELDQWFPLPGEPVAPLPAMMIAAAVRDGPYLHTVDMIGEPKLSEQQLADFKRFVQSLKWPKDGGAGVPPRPTWTLPKNWKELPNGMVIIENPDAPPIPVLVQVLAEAEEGSVLGAVNSWRAMFALPGVDGSELAEVAERLEVDGKTVTLVSLKTPADATPDHK